MQTHILYASFENIIAQNDLRLIRSGGGTIVFTVCQKQIFIVTYLLLTTLIRRKIIICEIFHGV